MSDYQPNFSTGPVIDASCTEASEFVQEKQLLVSQINKYGGCTEAAAAFLDKMSGLAKQFNHRTVGVPHLIIAMTLVPNAIRAFQARDISADIAFRSAMLSLIDMQRVEPGKPLAETSSDELLGVLNVEGDTPFESAVRGDWTTDPGLRELSGALGGPALSPRR